MRRAHQVCTITIPISHCRERTRGTNNMKDADLLAFICSSSDREDVEIVVWLTN